MMPDGIDVDRIAAIACDSLGLVTPDQQGPDEPTDEIVVIIHIAGGLLADVGARRANIPRLRVVVVDDDNYQVSDGDEGVWTETTTALEVWPRDADSALVRATPELPGSVVRELGLGEPD
jgi:hypothetical protein